MRHRGKRPRGAHRSFLPRARRVESLVTDHALAVGRHLLRSRHLRRKVPEAGEGEGGGGWRGDRDRDRGDKGNGRNKQETEEEKEAGKEGWR